MAKQITEDKLKERNKITETLSLTVLGNHNMAKDTITQIQNEKLGINGYYTIQNSSHSITGTKETVSINIKKLKM